MAWHSSRSRDSENSSRLSAPWSARSANFSSRSCNCHQFPCDEQESGRNASFPVGKVWHPAMTLVYRLHRRGEYPPEPVVNLALSDKSRGVTENKSRTGVGLRARLSSCGLHSCGTYARNPRLLELKLPMLGKILLMLAAGTPNHSASVAPYCATLVVGMNVPRLLASRLPPTASSGKLP